MQPTTSEPISFIAPAPYLRRILCRQEVEDANVTERFIGKWKRRAQEGGCEEVGYRLEKWEHPGWDGLGRNDFSVIVGEIVIVEGFS